MSDTTNSKPEHKFIELSEFKALEDTSGGFSGYANNFGVLDSWNDITLPGCFAESLKAFEDGGFGGADHRWGIVSEIGIVNKAFEDSIGLFVEVGYHPTADAQIIRDKVNNRLANNKKCCLSIGYSSRVRGVDYEYVVGEEAAPYLKNPSQEVLTYLKEKMPLVRLLKKVKLYEASVVSVGANSDSEITESKSAVIDARTKEFSSLVNTKKIQILNLRLRALPA